MKRGKIAITVGGIFLIIIIIVVFIFLLRATSQNIESNKRQFDERGIDYDPVNTEDKLKCYDDCISLEQVMLNYENSLFSSAECWCKDNRTKTTTQIW